MCLSTVYRKDCGEDVFMLKNIARVDIDGDILVFTDLMGVRTEISGAVLNIDLLENTILIKVKTEI